MSHIQNCLAKLGINNSKLAKHTTFPREIIIALIFF